jgi:predicted transcriptional regulator
MHKRDIYHIKRRNLGITLQEIAGVLGVHHSSISRHETGKINFQYAEQYYKYIDNKQSKLNK